METTYKKSEFVVSEDTAKWIRLIQNLQSLSNDIYALVNDDDVNANKYSPHFSALEDLLVAEMGHSVTNNLAWKDFPKNMI